MALPKGKNLLPGRIVGYVVAYSWRHQLGLAVLSVAVFGLATLPLELQRRLINVLVDRGPFATVIWLAAGYGSVAFAEQALKLLLIIYRGWVAEDSVRNLRRVVSTAADRAESAGSIEEVGAQITMVLEEVEPIGGFTGISLSEPLLQLGILVSVIGYMFVLDWQLACLGLLLFSASDRVRSPPAVRDQQQGTRANPRQTQHQFAACRQCSRTFGRVEMGLRAHRPRFPAQHGNLPA